MNDILFSRGRKPNETTLAHRKAVFSIISEKGQGSMLTAPEVSDKMGVPCSEVLRALKFFSKAGIVEMTDKRKKTKLDGGRPAIMWKVL